MIRALVTTRGGIVHGWRNCEWHTLYGKLVTRSQVASSSSPTLVHPVWPVSSLTSSMSSVSSRNMSASSYSKNSVSCCLHARRGCGRGRVGHALRVAKWFHSVVKRNEKETKYKMMSTEKTRKLATEFLRQFGDFQRLVVVERRLSTIRNAPTLHAIKRKCCDIQTQEGT